MPLMTEIYSMVEITYNITAQISHDTENGVLFQNCLAEHDIFYISSLHYYKATGAPHFWCCILGTFSTVHTKYTRYYLRFDPVAY